jgi:AAA family ATP:ADP antiporter
MVKLPLRKGERLVTALMFCYIFGALTFYYILKPLRSGLFLKSFPASQLPYAYFLTAFFAGTLATLIFKLHRSISLIKLMTGINLAIIATLFYFQWAMGREIAYLPYVYYVYVQIVSVLSTAQFWLLAGYIYDNMQSKRIFPLLGAGAIAGAMAGSFIPGFMSAHLTTQSMLLICMGVCGLLILLSQAAWRFRRPGADRAETRKFEETKDRAIDLLRLAFGSRHLSLMILLIFLTLIASQISDWQLNAASQAAYEHLPKDQMESAINELWGRFYFFTNIIGILLQAALSGFVVRRYGIATAILFLPVSLFLTAFGVFLLPTLSMAVLCLGSNSVFRYSINRVGLELLYLPLSPEARKKIKLFIDVFVDRLGRAIAGLIVMAMTGAAVTLGLRGTAAAMVLVCGACISVCLMLRNSYVAAFRRKLARHEVDLTEVRRYVNDPASVSLLTAALGSRQERPVLYALRLLQSIRGVDFTDRLLPLTEHVSPLVREEAARTLVALPETQWTVAERLLADPSDGVRDAAVEYICSRAGDSSPERIERLLQHDGPQVRRAAARCLAENPAIPFRPATELVQDWMRRSDSDAKTTRVAAAYLAARLPAQEAVPLLRSCLAESDPQIVAAAALAAGKAGYLDLTVDITRLLAKRRLRLTAREALISCGSRIVGTLGDMLSDPQQGLEVRLEIPWVLSRIPVQRSAEVLVDNLGENDRQLRFGIVKALNRLHEERPELPIPREAVQAHIYAEARLYYETLCIHQSLSSGRDGAPRLLLVRSLREHLDEYLEIIFLLLGLHYSQKDIHSAYRAMRDSKADARASAVEFLDSILHKDLKSMLLPLLEERSAERMIQRASRVFSLEIPAPEEALRLLLHQNDRWLKSCALYEVGAGKLHSFFDLCRSLRSDRDSLVGQTAAWAAAQF